MMSAELASVHVTKCCVSMCCCFWRRVDDELKQSTRSSLLLFNGAHG